VIGGFSIRYLLILIALSGITIAFQNCGSTGFYSSSAVGSREVAAATSSASKPLQRMVFAHYMPGFTGGVDYPARILDANSGKSKGVGDAPLYAQSFFPGATPWGSTLEDFIRYEIRTAMSVGVDGFSFDYGGGMNQGHQVYLPTIDAFFSVAEAEFPTFRLAVALDEAGHGGEPSIRQNSIQEFLQKHQNSPVLMRVGDRPVFFSYRASALDPYSPPAAGSSPNDFAFIEQQLEVIKSWQTLWRNLNVNPVFITDLPNAWQWRQWGFSEATIRTILSSWADAFDGLSVWGGTDTLDQARWLYPIMGSICNSRHKIFMAPVWWGYFASHGRILMSGADMALGTWTLAQDAGAQWITVNTWNDYSEQSNWDPSITHGYGLSDILKAESAWFKTGQYAFPEKPQVILFYRRFLAPAAGIKTWLPLDDTLDVVTLSLQPGELKVGNLSQKISSGIESHRFPLPEGHVEAEFSSENQTVIASGEVAVTKHPLTFLWGTYIASSNFDQEIAAQFGAPAPKDDPMVLAWKSTWLPWIDPAVIPH